MIFILFTFLALAIAFWPTQISLLARVMGVLSAAWNWVYGSAVLAGHGPLSQGLLNHLIQLDPSPPAVAVTGAASVALALFATVGYDARSAANTKSINISIPTSVSMSLLVFALFSGLYVVSSLGFKTLLQYEGYGSIKDLMTIYSGNMIGLIIASSFRIASMVLVIVTVYRYGERAYGYCLAALIPISISVGVGLAESSRISSVYFGIAAIGFFMTKKKILAAVFGLATILSVAYSLEARSHSSLGLMHVPEYVSLALGRDNAVEDVLTNVAAGQFITSASIRMGYPEGYSTTYKILSFSPTLTAMDGFQKVKATDEQRAASWIPFNAFAEAYMFGPVYYVILWCILGGAALAVNSAASRSRLLYLVLVGLFCLGWVYATQYNVRNSLRYFYLIIGIRIAFPFMINWWKQRPRPTLTSNPTYLKASQ
jgi:hypothetical protein